ncbi:hypothetical protein ACFL1M_00220 [Patescibacteria group bacterium]
MKKITSLLAGVVLLAIVMPAMAAKPTNTPNNGTSGEKITGSIEIDRGDENMRYAEFNAHEAYGDKDAKGEFHWWMTDGKGLMLREIYVDVTDVRVMGDDGWFEGMATHDSQAGAREGDMFYVKVFDGGTPATDGDMIWWSWDSPAYKEKALVGGNLVVHSNPCEVYELNVSTVNGNGGYWHTFELTFCPGEEPYGTGKRSAGTETASDIVLEDGMISFRSDYDESAYYWFPSFYLEEGGELIFNNAYGPDNVKSATGTWLMYTE